MVCVRGGEGSRIIVRDLETGQEHELARRTSPAMIPGLVLSPDGHQVAFTTRNETGGSSTLNLIPLSGGDTRELLRAQTPDALGLGDWTPDGRYIVFGRARGDSKDPQSSKTTLWRIAAEGRKAEKLDLAMDNIRPLRIHPDGRRVAFGAGSPAWELWVMENFLPVVRAAK
jgi:Tol biopolymer transport system component